MKKRSIPAAVALAAGTAQAYLMGVYDNGLLVPQVRHNGLADTTAVALETNNCFLDQPANGGDGAIDVYWTFFDEDSRHVTDGVVPMTLNDLHVFVWANESGEHLENVPGYLVFFADVDNDGALTPLEGDCLAGEAFHVVAADNDVAYKPAFPLDWLQTNSGAGVPDLTAMTATTITQYSAGFPGTWVGFLFGDQYGVADFPGNGDNETLTMRYSIANGDTTEIVVWSAEDIGGAYTVNLYDDEQNRKSVNLVLPNAEQNTIDPSTITGRPASFVNGFLEWRTPDDDSNDDGANDANDDYIDNGGDGNGIVSYSVVRSAAFGARQTILNSHFFDFFGGP